MPPQVKANRGFSGACNAGAALAQAPAILFLNNDAYARRGAIERLAQTLVENEDVGIVGARLLYADETIQHAGLAMLAGDASRWWHVHKRLPADFPDALIPRDLYAVTGAAMLVRRSVFLEIGGFDEGFRNGWEDIDLCLRVWQRGLRIRYEPRAVFEHLESATLGHTRGHEANGVRFNERWKSVAKHIPRYPLSEVPPVAFATQNIAADEIAPLMHVRKWWGKHFGSAIMQVRAGSRFDRRRVELSAWLAKRRPTLEVSWGTACLFTKTGARRVAFVAPSTPRDAHAYARAAGIDEWWVPTVGAHALLLNAGCPPERVVVMRLGADEVQRRPSGAQLTVAMSQELWQRLDMSSSAGAAQFERRDFEDHGDFNFSGIDVFVTARQIDRFGRAIPLALAAGCVVLTDVHNDPPIYESLGIGRLESDVTRQLVHFAANPDELRAGADDRARDALRRLHAYLATQHAAERARWLVGGAATLATCEVTPERAALLRASAV